MGMTLSAVNAVQGVCAMWLNTRNPEFGKLIALRNWKRLDESFNQIVKQAMVVCIILSAAATLVISGLQLYTAIGTRFLPVLQLVIFLAAVCGNIFIFGWANYMRAHKQEPMLVLSIIGAFLIGSSTFFLGIKFAGMGMAVGYCLVTVIYGIPSTYILWQRFRRRHHDT